MKRSVILSAIIFILTILTSPCINSQQKKGDVSEIVNSYLELKNALADDNPGKAAEAGEALKTAFKNYNKSSLTPDQKKQFDKIAVEGNENADHISESGSNIAHQRDHFDLLSKNIYDLVKRFGAGKTLYKIFCPMFNEGKGAFWLNESKEVHNPYYGKSMPGCGSVTEELFSK